MRAVSAWFPIVHWAREDEESRGSQQLTAAFMATKKLVPNDSK